ncbi:processed acidic surface protein [Oceanobacillus saliphilus]|uniref:processed acidic surface protein n=1 Tax=Oceanobacillus saliphilus TaxID=2925834 RepID=UPI00201DACF6|nr:processed acidic surface protein [Oceanobacillus saliphilus]
MKSFVSLLLAVFVVVGFLPVTTFAIDSKDPDFENFLKNINWEKQAYIDYLKSKDWPLEDFWYIDELGTPITDESIQPVLNEFELSRKELNELLIENGDLEAGQDVLVSEWYIFAEEVRDYVDFYINGWTGTPIDDNSIQEILDLYGFQSKEALESFLNEYGDSIENYQFIEDLDWAIYLYMDEVYMDEMYALFGEIGLTEEEIGNLISHFETLNYDDPTFLDKLFELSDRMIAFEYFDAAEELSAAQIAELLAIFNELQNLFQIKTKFYLVKGEEKNSLSIESLLTMYTTNGYDLLIEIYDLNNKFLADILLTADMFGSELIQETGKDLKKTEEIIVTKQKLAEKPRKSEQTVQTVKGGKLPDTASNYAENTMIGLALLLAGLFLFRRLKTNG